MASTPKETGAWGIYRDGELYGVEPARWSAEEQVAKLNPGSKHDWHIARVRVTPVGCR